MPADRKMHQCKEQGSEETCKDFIRSNAKVRRKPVGEDEGEDRRSGVP